MDPDDHADGQTDEHMSGKSAERQRKRRTRAPSKQCSKCGQMFAAQGFHNHTKNCTALKGSSSSSEDDEREQNSGDSDDSDDSEGAMDDRAELEKFLSDS